MAALGHALRALGHGLRVYVVELTKTRAGDLYLQTMAGYPGIACKRYGRPSLAEGERPGSTYAGLAQQALDHAKEVVTSGKYDLVILDRVNLALERRLIELDGLLSILEAKPKGVEVILTGRHAHPEVIALADLVTDMHQVKGPPLGPTRC